MNINFFKNMLGKSKFYFISLIIAALSSGCTPSATLTVQTQPEGGYISVNGKSYGVAPVKLSYENLTKPDEKGCYMVMGVDVKWVSGSTKNSGVITLCGSPIADYNLTIDRAPSDPGLDKDLQFAMQVQNSNPQNRSMSGGVAALYLLNSAIQGYNEGSQESSQSELAPTHYDCQSYARFGRVDTQCRGY